MYSIVVFSIIISIIKTIWIHGTCNIEIIESTVVFSITILHYNNYISARHKALCKNLPTVSILDTQTSAANQVSY